MCLFWRFTRFSRSYLIKYFGHLRNHFGSVEKKTIIVPTTQLTARCRSHFNEVEGNYFVFFLTLVISSLVNFCLSEKGQLTFFLSRARSVQICNKNKNLTPLHFLFSCCVEPAHTVCGVFFLDLYGFLRRPQ